MPSNKVRRTCKCIRGTCGTLRPGTQRIWRQDVQIRLASSDLSTTAYAPRQNNDDICCERTDIRAPGSRLLTQEEAWATKMELSFIRELWHEATKGGALLFLYHFYGMRGGRRRRNTANDLCKHLKAMPIPVPIYTLVPGISIRIMSSHSRRLPSRFAPFYPFTNCRYHRTFDGCV